MLTLLGEKQRVVKLSNIQIRSLQIRGGKKKQKKLNRVKDEIVSPWRVATILNCVGRKGLSKQAGIEKPQE